MRFDSRRRRYVSESGRVLSPSAVRKQVTQYVDQEVNWARTEANKLLTGLVDEFSFFSRMEAKIEAWHKVTGVIAYGGRAQMDSERWARLDRIVESERGFLAGFRNDMAQATVTKSSEIPDGIVNRAGMYPNAAYSTYENQVLQREADHGVTFGRRVCEADGSSCESCVEAATDEFIPLDDIPDIGSLDCLNNCRCEIEFSVGGEEFLTSDLFSATLGGDVLGMETL